MTVTRLVALGATSAAINTTETQIVAGVLNAGTIRVGDLYRVIALGTCTCTVANLSTLRVRIGPTSLSGVIPAVVTATSGTTGVNSAFKVELFVSFRSIGSSGTALGGATLSPSGSGGISSSSAVAAMTTATVTVDTTVANLIEFTYVTAATTTTSTFYIASIELVQ